VAEERRWFDSTQPQTLQGAVILCYISAAFGLLWILLGAYPLFEIVPLALGAAGYGVANEKRWAYRLGVVVAVLDVLSYLAIFVLGFYGIVLNLFFAVVLLALLLHSQSREYERIWFH
jgi:hypothetical protein